MNYVPHCTILFTKTLYCTYTVSPLYDVLDHTNHTFSESLSSGDGNDQDKDTKRQIQRQRHKDTDQDMYKVLLRPNVCYSYQKQGPRGFKDLEYYIGCLPVTTKTKTKTT